MFSSLKNKKRKKGNAFLDAFKIEELRKKIFFTLAMILLFRLGSVIPIPFVKLEVIKEIVGGNPLLANFSAVLGGSFNNFSIFALGISPYITGSIIIQLLTIAVPHLEDLSKHGGELGKKKIKIYTRYAAVVLGTIQATGITLGLFRDALVSDSPVVIVSTILLLVIGSVILMFMGEKMTDKGIGNGTSVIIFVSIISGLPKSAINLFFSIQVLKIVPLWIVVLLLIATVALISLVVLVQEGSRKVPVQYAKKMVGRALYQGQSSHIPIKINQASIMPVIFASSVMALPATVAMFSDGAISKFMLKWFTPSGSPGIWVYALTEVFLIVFFNYFYTMIVFNTEEIADNMKKNNSFIPGIRPGAPTVDYLDNIVGRLVFVGSVFLATIALLPIIVGTVVKINFVLGGTSLLIIVSVVLEILKQIKSQRAMKNYDGFLYKK